MELADLKNVEFVVGNGQGLRELDDRSTDVVYSLIILQHIPDPAITCAYVRDIGGKLRPGDGRCSK